MSTAKCQLHVCITQELFDKLCEMSAGMGVSNTAVVTAALKYYYSSYKVRPEEGNTSEISVISEEKK